MNGLADGRNLCALLSGFRDCLWLVNAKPQWVVTGVLSIERVWGERKETEFYARQELIILENSACH